MTKIKELFDEREEVIFWILLSLTVLAVSRELATFTEAATFIGAMYGALLAKKAADKRVKNAGGNVRSG